MTISNDCAAQLKAAREDSDRLRQALVQADRENADKARLIADLRQRLGWHDAMKEAAPEPEDAA